MVLSLSLDQQSVLWNSLHADDWRDPAVDCGLEYTSFFSLNITER